MKSSLYARHHDLLNRNICVTNDHEYAPLVLNTRNLSVPNKGYNRNLSVPNEGYNRNLSVPNEGYNSILSIPNEGYNSILSVPNEGYNSILSVLMKVITET